MAVSIKEQIFGLKVSIDDVLCMEVFKGKGYFGGIEFGNRVGETLI